MYDYVNKRAKSKKRDRNKDYFPKLHLPNDTRKGKNNKKGCLFRVPRLYLWYVK